ncbi:MAG: Ig-like domain-containing protein [Methanosarcinales archaeon]
MRETNTILLSIVMLMILTVPAIAVDTTPPVVISASANPDTIVANGIDSTLLNVTAYDESGIASVTVNLSAIGGSQNQLMDNISGVWQFYTNTTIAGSFNLPVKVTDNAGNSNTSVSITLNATTPSETINATIVIKPETLKINKNSKARFVVFIKLPEGYNVTDINLSTVVCEGAHAIKGIVANDTFIALFKRADLRDDLPSGNAVKLTVTGELMDRTKFKGSDNVRVIKKGKRNK